MSQETKLAALVVTVLFIGGCASVPPPNCVALDHGGQVCLLPPAQLPPLDGAHMVTLDQDGKRRMFIGLLHIDAHVIRLAGSSLFGPTLFTISYDGQALHSEPGGIARRAGLLIAMLELVTADRQDLRAALRGLTLTQTTAVDGGRMRRLFEHKRQVAQIIIGAGSLTQATIRFDIPSAHLSVLMVPLASRVPSPP